MTALLKPGAAVLSYDPRFPHYAARVLACDDATRTCDVRIADETDKALVPSEYDTKKRLVKISLSKLKLI